MINFDRYLKNLTPVEGSRGAYRCEALDGLVYRTSPDHWMFSVAFKRDVSIALENASSILDMDRFVGAVLATPVPHTKIRRARPGPYAYDPWLMPITVAEHNPGWGSTFRGRYQLANGHFDLYLNRLKNLRAFLKHVQEIQSTQGRLDSSSEDVL